jgi:glycosyltransferase involved in cell wall biosynthesis
MMGAVIKESYAVNTQFHTKYINLSTSLHVDEIGKRGIIKWWRYLGILCRTSYHGLFWRPHLVYITLTSQGMGLWKDAVIVGICRLLGLKHAFHFHNKGVKKYADSNKKADCLYRVVFKKAKVVLLSPLLYPDIEEYVSNENVFFCSNGIKELDKKSPSPTNNLSKPIKLMFLSNLIESKGMWDLLDACQYLKEKLVHFQCDLVGGEGDVSQRQLKKEIEQRDLQGYVNFLGKRYGDEKVIAFQNTDIFVFPTYYHNECFPLVLLEAMQFGLPIITTEEGAISDIIEDGLTGFITPKRNARALAEKLEVLIQNQELRTEMGFAGRKKFEEEYTLEHFEKRFINTLKQII